ncbi:MAG: hypothetical protein K5785_02300 [Nitrosarchaeum sp.]|nr:hypothetical protein [Nitrosarchaeum sp.]
MKNKTPIIFLLAISLFAGNLQIASAQNLNTLSDYSVHLAITPDHIEDGPNTHPIGYVYVLSKNGVSITSSQDVRIALSSDNPQIASVPDNVVLKANQEYASFDVTTGVLSGSTTITATLNDKTTFQKIEIGNDESHLPSDMVLELNLPTGEMHVNSAMPFSVYLRTSDGFVIRAPVDIPIDLEFENILASPDTASLTIKKGDYYAWGTISTHDKVGNTFLRAMQDELGLDTAKNIKISSTLPAALHIDIFPKLVPAEVERQVDVFVSVVDSDGNPTITPEDIPLKFFSNDSYSIGDALDKTMRELSPKIKKGDFGYYLRQELNLQHLLSNDILIGASAEGYGIATDTFSTVGESMNIENKKITERDVQIFVPDRMPANATTIVTYQLVAVETDDDDPEDTTEIENETDDEKKKPFLSIDDLDDGEFYPIQANENYYGNGYVKKLDLVSGNNNIVKISDKGKIEAAYSYGTGFISSGQKSGQVLISASVQGVGSDSKLIDVVNTLEQKKVLLFSPTGTDSLLFDREGFFDVFLIAMDGKERPKVLKHDSKYLITPTNGLIEIKKEHTFAFAKLRSDSFNVNEENSFIKLSVSPIGEATDLSLESTKTFAVHPSSKMKIHLPLENLNANHKNNFGIVQILDLQENPIRPIVDIKSKIVSSNEKVVQIIDDTVIPAGASYAFFPIKTSGSLGEFAISASAKGVIGTGIESKTMSSLSQLKIFASGLAEQIPVDEEIKIKLFVDDENAESVPNASVKINSDENSLIDQNEIRTGPDGSATISLTALGGPVINLEIIATAEGYSPGKDTITINVDTPENTLTVANLELPEWIGYIVVIALLMVVVLVVLFLRKSKAPMEEDWEEEEI